MKILRSFDLFCILLCTVFLSGCTEVRDRAYISSLAVHNEEDCLGTLRDSDNETAFAAKADTPVLLLDALQIETQKVLYTGHLSLIMLSGDIITALQDFLSGQWLAPSCRVLYTTENAALLLAQRNTDYAAQLQAAVQIGALPLRDAAVIAGDLECGTGLTAVPCLQGDTLCLSLWDSQQQIAMLSEAACRGLALMGDHWKTFRFAAKGADGKPYAVSVLRSSTEISCSQGENTLQIQLKLHAACKPESYEHKAWQTAAEQTLNAFLTAAMQETAAQGADLCCLIERIARDGCAPYTSPTPAQWQELLRTADYSVSVSVEEQK